MTRQLIAQQIKQLAAPTTAMLFFSISVFLYVSHNQLYFDILYLFAVPNPQKYPFIDLAYILAAIDCWRQGIDVYLHNPCDSLHRLYGYSPLWLRATFLPDVSWTNVVGIGVSALFLFSLFWLPPPRTLKETLILLLAIISPPVVFALERGNIDIMIFPLILLAAMLTLGGPANRVLGYFIVIFAGLLKFYPFVTLALTVRERVKIALTVIICFCVVLTIFVLSFSEELSKMAPNIPQGSYFQSSFSSANLPIGLSLIAGNGIVTVGLISITIIVLSATQIALLLRWIEFRWELCRLGAYEKNLMAFGAALISGCFIAAQNVGYRGIFLLLVLPGLLALWRSSQYRSVQKFAIQFIALILFVMWQGVVTWRGVFWHVGNVGVGSVGEFLVALCWLARELAWWWVIAILSGILLCIVLESRFLEWVRKRSSLRGLFGCS